MKTNYMIFLYLLISQLWLMTHSITGKISDFINGMIWIALCIILMFLDVRKSQKELDKIMREIDAIERFIKEEEEALIKEQAKKKVGRPRKNAKK